MLTISLQMARVYIFQKLPHWGLKFLICSYRYNFKLIFNDILDMNDRSSSQITKIMNFVHLMEDMTFSDNTAQTSCAPLSICLNFAFCFKTCYLSEVFILYYRSRESLISALAEPVKFDTSTLKLYSSTFFQVSISLSVWKNCKISYDSHFQQ